MDVYLKAMPYRYYNWGFFNNLIYKTWNSTKCYFLKDEILNMFFIFQTYICCNISSFGVLHAICRRKWKCPLLFLLSFNKFIYCIPGKFSQIFFKLWDHKFMYFYLIQITANSMFVAAMSFFAKISDPSIGGTYMTLLNTLCNLGGIWPATVALWLVDPLTYRQCSTDPSNSCSTALEKEVFILFFGNFGWKIYSEKRIRKFRFNKIFNICSFMIGLIFLILIWKAIESILFL